MQARQEEAYARRLVQQSASLARTGGELPSSGDAESDAEELQLGLALFTEFDVDGDGQVSQRDYFLAKQFDQDKDGKLNAEELATARKAIKEGYETKFLFGLEASAN